MIKLKTLPEFPGFAEIDIGLQATVKDYLSCYPVEASEYTFTNMYAYRDAYDFRISRLRNNLVIVKNVNKASLFCPVGRTDIPETMMDVFAFLKKQFGHSYAERVPESFVKKHLSNNNHFVVEEERGHFDYIYNVQDLIDLSGRKYHDKKNRLNKFRNSYRYEYSPITLGLINECLEFEEYWCEVRECEKYYGMNKERCAILEMLRNFNELGLKGGIIRIDNKIAALTIGEKISDDTLVVHIEKANAHIPGLYQAINQEFLVHEAGGCTYVNREQDLGLEGLRKSKMSYNPVKFVKKYKITELEGNSYGS